MQDKIKKTDQLDDFSKIIREKLENHQLPVDVNGWEAIEKRMKPKRKIAPWWMWIPIGSVAFLVMLFTLRSFHETPTLSKNAEIKSNLFIKKNRVQTIDRKVFGKKEELITLSTQNAVNKKIRIQKTIPTSLTNNQFVVNDSNNNYTLKETILGNISKNKNIAKATNDFRDSIPSKLMNRNLPDNLPGNPIVEQKNDSVRKPKTQNGWLLAAAFGSGSSGVSSALGSSDILTGKGNVNLVSAATNYTNILTPNDFSKIVYLPPVSFGLMVRKNLDKVWSLESGLVYTYMLSTFDNQGTQRRDAKLHLHYIGVPLNIVFRIWNNPIFEVYISGGGMVEKGLQSVYIQNEYYGNQIFTTNAQTNIDGLQWSLNGAIGTTYKLQRNIGIYFEPKFSYFFDNNQPVSARTDKPIVVGLTAGLRFQF